MEHDWLFEETNHAFALEIWVEPSEKHDHHKHWRARIIHVPSGDQKYVENFTQLLEVRSFFLVYRRFAATTYSG
jgi:hypothetical protein